MQVIKDSVRISKMVNMAKLGKPPINNKQTEVLFRKLEPYLRCGISVHRACQEAKIPKSQLIIHTENLGVCGFRRD